MLIELKQIIDSMKSRIENDAVDKFLQQLSIIKGQYTDNAAVISVIKILHSIGKYLGSQKNNVGKDTIPVLNAIAIELERLVQAPDLNKEQIHQILSKCIQNYNSLKNEIALHPLVTTTEMNDLKAVIFAIDGDISEATLQTFEAVTGQMLTKLKPHKILHAFLGIIHSMGRYIALKKATAHKDAIFFLHAVFKNFERVVQAPDMPFQEKKQLIESDIDTFHKFKRVAASLNKKSPVPMEKTGKDILPPGPQDAMDELSCMKKSPADKLPDAIPLTGTHGPDHEKAMNMSDPTEDDLQKKGIKDITLPPKNNEPISEIGDRLDEFFSMDFSKNKDLTIDDNEHPMAALDDNKVAPPGDRSMEAIVPFPREDDPTQVIIHKLNSLVNTRDALLADNTAMDKGLSYLKTLWQDDPDKTMLLNIISCLTQLIKTQSVPVSKDTNSMGDKTVPPPIPEQLDPEQLDKHSPGFRKKIKSFFFK